MNPIALTLRYPKPSRDNLIYIYPESIVAFGPNMTAERGVMGSVVYTTNPVAFHVAEESQIVYDLITQAKRNTL
jgi:hypothetical protein